MLHRRGATILLFVTTVAFGVGLRVAQAGARNNWCDTACAAQCNGHGGCDASQASGCTCTIVCDDGHETAEYCTF